MKRSAINRIVAEAEADFTRVGFALPPFARWSAADWHDRAAETGALVAAGLGWDVTDFGRGRFTERGLLLFTLRNGSAAISVGNRPYAEKIMIARRDQVTPMHRHAVKVEDIIVRASLSEGARLAVRLFATDADGGLDRTSPVAAHRDGLVRTVAAGTVVALAPGESITLFPGTFHAFWGQGGDVVVGEVSTVNDDLGDNIFAEPLRRFAGIEEDEAPTRLLATDVAALGPAA